MAAVVALVGCGNSGDDNDVGSRSVSGPTKTTTDAATTLVPRRVATKCPSANVLDVGRVFRFRRVEAHAPTQPETELMCAYRSGPEVDPSKPSDPEEPSALITFTVGEYGDGVDQNFDAIVELAKCSRSDDVDPVTCTSNIDERYSSYKRDHDRLEAIEIDEPLGLPLNPGMRFGTISVAYKTGTKICAAAYGSGFSSSDDPHAHVKLGENVIRMVKTACGR